MSFPSGRLRRARRETFSLQILESRLLMAYAPAGPIFDVDGAPGISPAEFRAAADVRGRVTVVWQGVTDQGVADDAIYARRFEAGGTPLGGAFRVGVGASDNQGDPRVAVAADGSTVVSWLDGSVGDGRFRFRFRLYDADGVPIGGVRTMDGLEEAYGYYELAGLGPDGFVVTTDGLDVAWYGLDGSRRGGASMGLAATGSGWWVVESHDPARLWADAESGTTLLTWTEARNSYSGGKPGYEQRVVVARLKPDGTPASTWVVGSDLETTTRPYAYGLQPALVLGPGIEMATWKLPPTSWLDPPASPIQAMFARDLDGGAPVGEPFGFVEPGGGEANAVTALDSGTLAVHYYDGASTPNYCVRIWAPDPSSGDRWTPVGDPIPAPDPDYNTFLHPTLVPTHEEDFWIMGREYLGGVAARRVFDAGSTIEFARTSQAVGEADGRAVAWVVRSGDLSRPATVAYRTYAAGAYEGHDFLPASGVLTFEPGRSEASIVVPILDDRAPDPGKAVVVGLSGAVGATLRRDSTRIDLVDDEPVESNELTFFDFDADGIWTYDDAFGWTRINAANPEAIVASPDRSAYVSFGPYGLWAWDGVRGWRKLNDVGPEGMAVASGTLFLDYGASGLWSWSEAAGWAKLDADDPARLFTSGAALLVDFPASGLKSWDASSGYRDVSPLRPESVSGVGGSFYLDFGAAGLWLRRLFDPSAPWMKVSEYDAQAIAAGRDAVTIDFGRGGLWRWSEAAGFARLDDRDVTTLAVGQLGAFIGFDSGGLQLLTDSGVWIKLNDVVPAEIAESLTATDAWVNYGRYGLWRWDPTGWRKMRDLAPTTIARM